MKASPLLYGKLLALSVLLTVVISVNIAIWGLRDRQPKALWHVPVARPERAPALIREYGCGGCHIVPGVRGANGLVGPRLDRLSEQIYIAGVLPNTPQNLVTWIQQPREVDPLTAMPNLGVQQEDARDIAAYLYAIP